MANEIEDIYKRMSSFPRVTGFLVINGDGLPIKTTVGQSDTFKYAGMVAPLVLKARKVIQELVIDDEENTDDDIEFFRVRTNHYEILIVPEGEFAMVAIQLPHEKDHAVRNKNSE